MGLACCSDISKLDETARNATPSIVAGTSVAFPPDKGVPFQEPKLPAASDKVSGAPDRGRPPEQVEVDPLAAAATKIQARARQKAAQKEVSQKRIERDGYEAIVQDGADPELEGLELGNLKLDARPRFAAEVVSKNEAKDFLSSAARYR